MDAIEKKIVASINNHWKDRDFRSVLDYFRILFLHKGFNINFHIYSKARAAYLYMNNDPNYKNYWIELTPEYMKKSSYLVKHLANKTISQKESMAIFSSIITSMGINNSLATAYNECFSIIVDACINNNKCEIPESFIKHSSHIICSGMGWSGSGAVIDYFREFSGINFVLGESQLLEGAISFLSLINSIRDIKTLLVKLIEFFFITIIGSIKISDAGVFKQILVKNWLFNDNDAGIKIISQYYVISSIIANIICSCTSNSIDEINHLIMRLGNELISLISANVPNDKIPLLDNCIHTTNLNIIEYLNSVKIVSVLRDPRSTFVSRCLEDRGFDKNISNFVSQYKSIRRIIDDACNALKMEARDNIIILSFEDFVMNENKRAELQQTLGIRFGEWAYRKNFFNEEISIKNVYNFKNFDNQDQIRLIENNLKEYLFPF